MHAVRLRLENYKGFVSADIDLDRPLTVLVGDNASGKTAILYALAVQLSRFVARARFPTYTLSLAVSQNEIRFGAEKALLELHLRYRGGTQSELLEVARADIANQEIGLRRVPFDPPLLGVLFAADRFRLGVGLSAPHNMPSGLTTVNRDESPLLDQHFATTFSGAIEARFEDTDFADFISWFSEAENVENELKVLRHDLSLQAPDLQAVRHAVRALNEAFVDLRYQRAGRQLVGQKDTPVSLDQMSSGERALLGLAGDISRRLAILNPASPNPNACPGVVLIDEIESHLHPGWQRLVLERLISAFPNCQFVVTTHSPQVVASAPPGSVIRLTKFAADPVDGATFGRDSNSLLEELFRVAERPEHQKQQIEAIAASIEHGRYEEARTALRALAANISVTDTAVVRLSTMLHFMDSPK